MKNIVIIGASGHGSVVLDCIEKEGKYNVLGFVDSFKEKGTKQNGYEILGTENDLLYLMEMFNIYGGIVAIGDNWTRKSVVDRISEIVPNFNFITSIHPSAIIGKDVQIGMGTIIMPGAIVNANSEVRGFCILNTNASLGHDGVMDDFSSMASGVRAGGNFHLGKYSVVCMGVIIIENVRIKEQTVIGAGSLVIKDVGGYVVAYGSPALIVRKRKAGDKYLSGNRNKTSVLPLMANTITDCPARLQEPYR
ncbi:sugar O-acyltransferase, sialic acid O-acetyltransferase NeuD family [Pricia antarctica]|uniref:Sugar O-acyltransferase, sialic acid O-acetyltransferase NeuD family n=1 Tax=Pricia antarctica TaxID=641691 RepID=A0A1G7J9K5_9FLAO|nr:acetyltransferase [Pricia antarctica]SDF21591.1 sugar O-acyltransferase, sialic acid O-acetyltransferase NeuD family [Pricia antarctica]